MQRQQGCSALTSVLNGCCRKRAPAESSPPARPCCPLPQKVRDCLQRMQSQWGELVNAMQAAVAEAATRLQQHGESLQQLLAVQQVQQAQQAQQQGAGAVQAGEEGAWAAQLAAVSATVEQQGQWLEHLSQVGWDGGRYGCSLHEQARVVRNLWWLGRAWLAQLSHAQHCLASAGNGLAVRLPLPLHRRPTRKRRSRHASWRES